MEQQLLQYLQEDAWFMSMLQIACACRLPNWYLGGESVRTVIWNRLHEHQPDNTPNFIDLLYFDKRNTDTMQEKIMEKQLNKLTAINGIAWKIRNQARTHNEYHDDPYSSIKDAIAHVPETVNAIGVRLEKNGTITLYAPYGVEDILHIEVCPTPYYYEGSRQNDYINRQQAQDWERNWEKVRLYRTK